MTKQTNLSNAFVETKQRCMFTATLAKDDTRFTDDDRETFDRLLVSSDDNTVPGYLYVVLLDDVDNKAINLATRMLAISRSTMYFEIALANINQAGSPLSIWRYNVLFDTVYPSTFDYTSSRACGVTIVLKIGNCDVDVL